MADEVGGRSSSDGGVDPTGEVAVIEGASGGQAGGVDMGRDVVNPVVGRVASPLRFESTSARFFFWVPRGTMVEKTQLVRTESEIGGKSVAFYGVVEEVYRRSRKRAMDEEVDAYDGDPDYVPPFAQEGVTFADVTVLSSDPPFLTPPLEQSLVYLCGESAAATAYGYGDMVDAATNVDWGLPVGLLRNGAAATVGVAKIDLRDLAGDRAGHLNATGQAGRGTKSSLLLVVVRSLIDVARRWDDGNPRREPFSVRPIVFNVKGNDLMYIDFPNRSLTEKRRGMWRRMGVDPRPFTEARFCAPCVTAANRAVARVRRPVLQTERQARSYYWTLADVVRLGLWTYLFSDETQSSETMMAMVDHVLGLIARDCIPDQEHPAGLRLRDPADNSNPQSFEELRDWLRDAMRDSSHPARDHGVHTFATTRALLSRLGLVLGREGETIFDQGTGHGSPPQVLGPGTTDPLVIDIATLPNELRRFVVAAVLHQIKENQVGPLRIPGQVYFLVLDELGIYAPRGARDPITRLFEHVAAQLRSQGIILLGAQQHASKVSETIFGNSEVKVLGATSPVELETPTWGHLLTGPQKARALVLTPAEKMVLAARGWMNVVVPFPAWAMKGSEAEFEPTPASTVAGDHAKGTDDFRLNLPED